MTRALFAERGDSWKLMQVCGLLGGEPHHEIERVSFFKQNCTRDTSCVASHVIRHTSYVTRHTSHVTHHTSHFTQHLAESLNVRIAVRAAESAAAGQEVKYKPKNHFKTTP